MKNIINIVKSSYILPIFGLICAVLLNSCSFSPSKTKIYPLRKQRRELPYEGKKHKPFFEKNITNWIYPIIEKKEYYDLIFDQNKALVGFSLKKEFPVVTPINRSNPQNQKIKELPNHKNLVLSREYKAIFPERAKQNMHYEITDTLNDSLEFRKTSLFYVFPRTYLPSLAVDEDETTLFFPNGENAVFQTHDMNLIKGVIKQFAQPKLNEFPNMEITGNSIVLRVDLEKDKIVSKGKVFIQDNRSGESCFVDFHQVFDYNLNIQFKFASDEAFFEFLEDNCDFLPTNFN